MAGENYADKEVLILGGGDGALLAELLAERPEPAHVTMVELDAAVMRAVRDHAPGLARGALDAEVGPRHLTVTGDALAYMEQVLGLYCTVRYYTELYCTVLYCTVLSAWSRLPRTAGPSTSCSATSPTCPQQSQTPWKVTTELEITVKENIPYGQSSAMLPDVVIMSRPGRCPGAGVLGVPRQSAAARAELRAARRQVPHPRVGQGGQISTTSTISTISTSLSRR